MIQSGQDVLTATRAQLGGKGFQLAFLKRNGFNVPSFFVIESQVFEDLLIKSGLKEKLKPILRSILENPLKTHLLAKEIRGQILALSLEKSLKEGIASKLKEAPFCNAFLSVRSSCCDEDSKEASFAGQMDSYLNVQGKDAVWGAYLNCLASAFSDRAIKYRIKNNLDIFNIKIAVIVQVMVRGDVSGVLFTANPENGKRHETFVSACYGLGEGVVSGACQTDDYTFDAFTKRVSEKISYKETMLSYDEDRGFGTKEISVAKDMAQRPCLTKEQVVRLCLIAKDVAKRLKFPQDIEWTIKDDEIWLLQTRPITSLPLSKDNEIVWDNSNIQESYQGVTLPLTFSYALKAYQDVYGETLRAMKVSQKQQKDYEHVVSNLLGTIEGRVYYNINHWYQGLLLLPSFKTNKKDMENMMGLLEPVDFVTDKNLTLKQKFLKFPKMCLLFCHLLIKFARIDTLVAGFEKNFNREFHAINRNELHLLDMSVIQKKLRSLRKTITSLWSTPIVNDFYVMMLNGKVSRRLARFFKHLSKEEMTAMQNRLLAGEENIASTEPTKRLLLICEKIRKEKSLVSMIEESHPSDILTKLQSSHKEIYESCLKYIDDFGDRTMGELKLESITLRQDARFMFSVIKNFLPKVGLTADSLGKKERALRESSEKEVFSKIKGVSGYFLKRDLEKLRKAVKNRESMRLARTRIFGLVRDIYLEIGRQLSFHNALEHPRDIFYLTTSEVEAYLEGHSFTSDLKPLVSLRKKEYASYEKKEPPHHFSTYGAVYAGLDFSSLKKSKDKSEDKDASVLKGTGCYPGIVNEKVRLILTPDDEMNLEGQILCTVRTDPGWAPLFPSAGGLLIERGSILSHSAVVARELGIPAIVGVLGITKKVKDLDKVKMDGRSGEVFLPKKKAPSSPDCHKEQKRAFMP